MPKLSLINKSICPPDGFRYVVPQTGFIAHAWDYFSWIDLCRKHYQVNDMDIPENLPQVMEEQLCQTLEPGWCNFDDPSRPRVNPILSWEDVKKGIATFSKWLVAGFKYVDAPEAEWRAKICSRCYMNVNIQGCSVCQRAAAELIGTRRTQWDHMLRGCAVCKCVLRAKVHFPIETLGIDNEAHQALYPEFCWMKKKSDGTSNGSLQS